MATWIRTTEWNDGQLHLDELALWTKEEVAPENGTDFSLKELQHYVGGYIEIVPLTNHELMIVDEEGKLKGLPINPIASHIYEARSFCAPDVIVGNVLICKEGEVR